MPSKGRKRAPYPSEFRRQMVDLGRADGLTSAERQELIRLRRENRQFKVERDILSRAAAWFARETKTVPPKERLVWAGSLKGYGPGF